jgi:type IV pilus assembly protein PilY1
MKKETISADCIIKRPKTGSLRLLILISLVLAVFSFLPQRSDGAIMNDYCIQPPFIQGVIPPNLLLMLDNSGSIYDMQYIDNSVTSTFCYDNSFKNTKMCSSTNATTCTIDANCPPGEICVNRYSGYFDPDKYYTSEGIQYDLDITIGNSTFSTFTEIAALPLVCTYKSPYLCLIEVPNPAEVGRGTCKKTGAGNCIFADCHCFAASQAADCPGPGNGVCQNIVVPPPTYNVTQFAARGNFLNWLATSKMDVQKQILTGGKYDTASGLLIGESRGCVGSRYVKSVPLADWTTPASPATAPITLGVRGDLSTDVKLPSQGGTTRIDIFRGSFNAAGCTAAVNCWATCGSSCGSCKNDTDTCLNLASVSGAAATWNHSLQTCWTCAHQPCCPEDIGNGDVTRVWTSNECGNAALDKTTLEPTNAQYICLKDVAAAAPTAATFAGCAMNNYAGQVGVPGKYIGACDVLAGVPKDICTQYQFAYYCKGVQVGQVTDPSGGPADTSTTGNIPANLIDGGLAGNLGRPMKTFHTRILTPSAPTGLIHEFTGQIRFGGMTFNTFGANSECNSTNPNVIYSCSADTAVDKDGGVIIQKVGATSGDHTTGLIKAIDDTVARTWTPFSEAMYNAIGYYAMTPTTTALTVKRLNATDFGTPADATPTQPPSQYRCQKNNVLLITDGQSTTDLNATVIAAISANPPPTAGGSNTFDTSLATVQAACPSPNSMGKYSGSRNFFDLAWFAQNRNISNLGTANASAPVNASDMVNTYTVFAGQDASLLTTSACAALGSAPPTATALCQPDQLMCYSANAGKGKYYLASDPASLKSALRDAFFKIAGVAASGTAASVLASGEGSGANLVQAVFYPSKRIGDRDVTWTGIMQNLWYFVDPRLGSSTIREDSIVDNMLSLTGDCILHYNFNSTTKETTADLFASNSVGVATGACPSPRQASTTLDDVHFLWETGKLLFARTPGLLNAAAGGTITSATTRRLFTNVGGVISAFDTSNAAALQPLLNVNVNLADDGGHTQAQRLIKYIRGIDDLDGDSVSGDANKDGVDDDTGDSIDGLVVRNRTATVGGVTNTWKLGDIINSTPKIMAWTPLNNYDKTYGDTTYKDFISTDQYKQRGTVFTGGNDGMLHAFKMGLLGVYDNSDVKATLGKHCSVTTTTACTAASNCPGGETCVQDTDLGQELWGFIPRNALPLLKYFASGDASNPYCHLYYVDSTPYIFDASIKKDAGVAQPANCIDNFDGASPPNAYWNCSKTKDSWRTIVIGSMRLGGACRDITSTCADCTKTPVSGLGYSSYFALDVTDVTNPTLLWEFSNPELGMTTTGPAIVRINSKACSNNAAQSCNLNADCTAPATCNIDKSKNGRWFVVVGSGPESFVTSGQFTGIRPYYFGEEWRSAADKNKAKLFVLDLANGDRLRTIDTNKQGAFIGNLTSSSLDTDRDYSDDVMYFGYTEPSSVEFSSPYYFDSANAVGTNNSLVLKGTASGITGDYKGKFVQLWEHAGSLFNRGLRLITAYDGPSKTATFEPLYIPTDSARVTNTQTFAQIVDGWTKGGVYRLVTKNSLSADDWALSTVTTGIGPVTSGVSKLQQVTAGNEKLRLYFGTGRYFFRVNDIIDDATGARNLYGILEPCFTGGVLDTSCTSLATAPKNTDALLALNRPGPNDSWYIPLDATAGAFGSERVVTDPLATTIGAVFFTSTEPSADICAYGGKTFLWAVHYDTGGAIPAGILKGKGLIQLSTGAIQEIDMSTAFTQRKAGGAGAGDPGRRTIAFEGVPPLGQGLTVIVPPKPVDTILHIRKK